jgi:lipopolysaccharide transport system ATP-binding protein
MSNLAIEVLNISKRYELGENRNYSWTRNVRSWCKNKLGKSNSYLPISNTELRLKESDFWALKNVSFEVQQGDRVAIRGNNGAGKSTLLKILSKVTSPTSGVIKGMGRIASLLEVGTGFHPELTGRENIFLNGAMLGMRKKDIISKFDEIVEFASVIEFLDTPVKRYSTGMYVRLAFSVAAHLEAETMIIDEVLSVGDSEFQQQCLTKLLDISKQEGRTILFVSHNSNAVKSLCNKEIILLNGQVIQS